MTKGTGKGTQKPYALVAACSKKEKMDLPLKLMKECTKCNKTLDVFAFESIQNKSSGISLSFTAATRNICIGCNKQYHQQYWSEKRLKINATRKATYHRTPELSKAKVLSKYHKIKTKIFDHYGYKCSCCGETEPRFLSIEHKNLDGAEHRRNKRTNGVYFDIIKANYPDSYEILCMNCNWSQRYGEPCPHKNEGE
jgi:hypothetical protein